MTGTPPGQQTQPQTLNNIKREKEMQERGLAFRKRIELRESGPQRGRTIAGIVPDQRNAVLDQQARDSGVSTRTSDGRRRGVCAAASLGPGARADAIGEVIKRQNLGRRP